MPPETKPTTRPNAKRLGRPPNIKDGRDVRVYLDSVSIKRAEELGSGSISAGIRAALASAAKP